MAVLKTCIFCVRVVKTASRNCHLSTTSTRVRFAPSPTGPMHIGGLRTALVNFMLARKSGGKFLLRIEDTDHSERKDIYRQYAERLVKSGHAYPCFCSPSRLEVLRKEQRRRGETIRYDNRCRHLSKEAVQRAMQENLPFVLRFKLSPTAVTLHDVVFKDVDFPPSDSEGDLVIIKSDGMPVYHFANVVDDHLMGITHVIRGSEWITSVPKHLQLYNAFGWSPPTFAHLPLMLSSSGKKFSKRLSAPLDLSLVSNLRQAGYLPSAVLTWISATGGLFASPSESDSLGGNSISERGSPCPSQWEPGKLIEELLPSLGSEGNICNQVRSFLSSALALPSNASMCTLLKEDKGLLQTLSRLRGRVSCLSDLSSEFKFLWIRPTADSILAVCPSLRAQRSNTEKWSSFTRSALEFVAALEAMTGHDDVNEGAVTAMLASTFDRRVLSTALIMKILRSCLTGSEVGCFTA
ncbi:unnamed protein product [Dibothriocephalus latus]|uniref:Glutamyl/glutaminyl-tRNA synthetase class Ib catalytic domain-containing protein n=1 Tax=Dibothriocephalus latus TaxID=60516 RepID=A0A3P6VBN9_DIBLA|nr:unnamed protein product [Dibothriocephalus latus]